MTLLGDRPAADVGDPAPSGAPDVDASAPAAPSPPTPARAVGGWSPRVLVFGWLGISAVGMVLVLAAFGPVTEQRDQRALLDQHRAEIESATNEAFGLAGVEAPTRAPTPGSPVGIVDVGTAGLRRVVVEGTEPEQTRQGPGHVVGTAGLGQPGNAVVVGRRSLFGGAFAGLEDLEPGDRVLVTTVQGQSVYEVEHVGRHAVVEADERSAGDLAPSPTTSLVAIDDDAPAAEPAGGEAAQDDAPLLLPDGAVTVDQLYGPSDDDRLTLVTSASWLPWSSDAATVVVARMDGLPFAPTPQGGRTTGDDGRQGGADGLAPLLLALVAYLAAIVAVVWLHRTLTWRSAYLLSAPLLVALTVVLAEAAAGMLPAWS